MALPKYTDPAVQNQTQDEATDNIDSLHAKTMTASKNKPVELEKSNNDKGKIKGYKEGNKDDTTKDENDEIDVEGTDYEYDFDEDDDELDNSEFYKKNL